MTLLTREMEQELKLVIHVNRREAGLAAMHKLLEHKLEKCKERLLVCQLGEFLQIQAEAQAVGLLLRHYSERPKLGQLPT